MVKKRKKKNAGDALEKLVKLTKLMKIENVQVAPRSPARPVNKWRSQTPIYSAKPQKSENVVEAGGMQVDPSLKSEYDLWRQDKIAMQNEQRAMALRRAEAKRKARIALREQQAREILP
jgi:hypothetical protein